VEARAARSGACLTALVAESVAGRRRGSGSGGGGGNVGVALGSRRGTGQRARARRGPVAGGALLVLEAQEVAVDADGEALAAPLQVEHVRGGAQQADQVREAQGAAAQLLVVALAVELLQVGQGSAAVGRLEEQAPHAQRELLDGREAHADDAVARLEQLPRGRRRAGQRAQRPSLTSTMSLMAEPSMKTGSSWPNSARNSSWNSRSVSSLSGRIRKRWSTASTVSW